jgi:hypothetical protein
MLFKHYKTQGHIKSTEVKIDSQITCKVWGKYVTEQVPTPFEREFLYKFFQRNWTEKIGDEANHHRIENGSFPDYITDNELYDWINTRKMIILPEEDGVIKCNTIVPYHCEITLDEV